jgi:hypothetical protein
MKKLIFFSILLSRFVHAQSTTILPTGLESYKITTNLGKGLEHNFGTISAGTYIDNTSGWFQTHSDSPLFIGRDFFYGITFFPNMVSYNQKVKFGSDAPAILINTFTGFTNSLQGAEFGVNTNVLQADVLNASLVVDCGAAGYVPQGYSFTNGYRVELRVSDNFVYVINVAGNSANILNKPFKLLITYK